MFGLQSAASNTSVIALHEVWKEEWGSFPDDPSDPVTIMYYKYATDPNGITASAFDRLLLCVIGSPLCHGSLSEMQDEGGPSPFTYLTDCKINSALSEDFCKLFHECNNGRGLISTVLSQNESVIDKYQFRDLLPFVLYQAQSQLCTGKELLSLGANLHSQPTSIEVWGYSILFVTLISAMSLAGVSVVPLMAMEVYQKLLTVFIGLAVGSLTASSAFHLIPQAFGIINSENHEYLFISLWILLGIYAFFMIERILKIILTSQKFSLFVKERCNREGSKDHYRIEESHTTCELNFVKTLDESLESRGTHEDHQQNFSTKCTSPSEGSPKHSISYEARRENSCGPQGKDSVIATVGLMIIFGDGFHNFIDGVSIGAAFQQSILTGISISLAVMFEELPHELGDFAVLVNSGMTMKQALFYNFLSATTCYIGMIVGIVIGEFTQKSTYVFALAAGMFLYISLVDMLPEMNESVNLAEKQGLLSIINILFLQTLGMAIGVCSLFLLAYYQDLLSF